MYTHTRMHIGMYTYMYIFLATEREGESQGGVTNGKTRIPGHPLSKYLWRARKGHTLMMQRLTHK